MNIRDNLKMPKGKGDIIKKIPAGLPAVSWVLLPCGCGSALNGVLAKSTVFQVLYGRYMRMQFGGSG